MQIEIVSHAYGDLYLRMLQYQIASLAAHEVDYRLTVCVLPTATCKGLGEGRCRRLDLPKPQLLQRGIGRNIVAMNTTADWVWFTDCDYMFGTGSLEAVCRLDYTASPLYYPRETLRSTFFFDDVPNGKFSLADFSRKRNGRAIGGIQIVPGWVARTHGYLDGHDKWQKPAAGDRMLDPREDRIFRSMLGTSGTPADIPNVFRLRHRIPKYSERHRRLPMES